MWAVAEDVVRWSGEGKAPAVARVVAFTGFGGRRAGEVLAVAASGGDRTGALLGGSADQEVLAAALHLGLDGRPQAEVLEVAVGDREAVDAGLACGGLARVLVQDAGSLPDSLWERLVARRPVALATVVRRGAREGAPPVGSAMVVVPAPRTTGETAGSSAGDGADGDPELGPRLGDLDLEERAVATATELLARPGEPVRLVAHEAGDLVVEAFVPPCRLVVVGDSSALADAIGRQAELLDWDCDVVPDLGGSLDAVSRLGSGDAVVVLSHDPDLDTPVLAAAVAGDAYVGALGSRHTQAARRERLGALGIEAAQVERVHGPVGLDLGARVPEETALAICAEILATRNGRNAASLRAGAGPING